MDGSIGKSGTSKGNGGDALLYVIGKQQKMLGKLREKDVHGDVLFSGTGCVETKLSEEIQRSKKTR